MFAPYGHEQCDPDRLAAATQHHVDKELMHKAMVGKIIGQLFEAAPDAILVIDEEGQIVLVNAQTERLFGYTREELINQPIESLLPQRFRSRHIQHRQEYFKNPHFRLMGTGRELYGLRKDSSEFPLEISLGFHETEEGLLLVSSAIRDISERQQTEKRFHQLLAHIDQQRQMLDTILSASADYVFLHDRAGRYLFASQSALHVLGLEKEDVEGKTWRELGFPAEAMESFDAELESVFTTGNPVANEIRFPTVNGIRDLETLLTPVWGSDGSIQAVVSTVRDITERKSYEAQLRYQANYDALTQLPNRNLLQDRLGHAIAHAHRYGRSVAVLFLDLDRFKMVNDSLGHRVGDALLQAAAARLTACVRKDDTVARLGGDEFVIVLEDLSGDDVATRVASKVLTVMENPFSIDDQEFFINCSLGISLFPRDGKDQETLIKNADTALHRAKDQGRGQIQFYTAEINTLVAKRLALETGLRRALEANEFRLHYQPQIDLNQGHIIGMEALLRWHHPQWGMIMPAEFISLAEETGLIVPIGEWALRTACAQLRAWHDADLPRIIVSVNLSSRQFMQVNLIDRVTQVLQETELEARYLELEITESLLMRDVEGAVTILGAFKAMGLHLAIDDFGTGYSSLNYLKRFPIGRLKIDRSFVRDVTTNPDDAAIAQAVIALAHSLGLEVLAEGVETEAQLAFLRSKRCHQMQGYYFSSPLAPEEMAVRLREDGRQTTL